MDMQDPTEKISPALEVAETKEVKTQETVENTQNSTDSGLSGLHSMEVLVDKLKTWVDSAKELTREELDSVKSAYHKIRKGYQESQLPEKTSTEETPTEPMEPKEHPLEELYKTLYTQLKEIRLSAVQQIEHQKEENLKTKQALLQELKAITESTEDIGKAYPRFKEIQQTWAEIKLIPTSAINDTWKSYQMFVEKFYDAVRLNNEMRDYDFKKNLELKTGLIQSAERLQEMTDPVAAFHQLQALHEQWREIGPVAKEIREDTWDRFKTASTEINKKHQAFFDGLKASEEANLKAKETLCDQVEAIELAVLKTFKQWEEKTDVIKQLQEQWKSIGFASKKHNIKVFERFRVACDAFFAAKSDFYKGVKEQYNSNLEKKKVLCEKAEGFKDSTDWKKTSDLLVALQKEWKTIGPVPQKYADSIWKRFVSACDAFFAERNKTQNESKSQERTNLEAKKAVLEKLQTLAQEAEESTVIEKVKALSEEWNAIGFVPFKEKDAIYKKHKEVLDLIYGKFRTEASARRLDSFKSSLQSAGQGRLYKERSQLVRKYEALKNEIQTYENNMGFLTTSSKSASGIVLEMEKKVAALRQDLEFLMKKIQLLDEKGEE